MRILITVFAWKPHFLPIVPLAWAAQLAGHEVRVAAMPTLTPTIAEAGLVAVPVGGHPDDAFARAGTTVDPPNARTGTAAPEPAPWPSDWPGRPQCLTDEQRAHYRRTGMWSAILARAQVPDLIALGRRWRPDVILHDPTQFAGPVVAAALDVPAIRYLTGHNGYGRIDTAYTDEPTADVLELFADVGAPVRTEPAAWLDPCPPRLQFPYPHRGNPVVQPMRYVPYNGPGVVPGWVDERPRRRRVCLTWGVTDSALGGAGATRDYQETVRAIADLDVELVLAVDEAQATLLGDLPDGVRAAVGVPLHALLRHCTAIAHHGGAGTTMTAAAAAVPQLVTTDIPSNLALAATLAEVGAARRLDAGALPAGPDRAALLRDEVAKLVDVPSYAEHAETLRAHMADQPAPSEIVSWLHEFC